MLRGGGGGLIRPGGITGYPLERLHEEVAYLAYHFHWDRESLMQMEHRERLQWVEQVAGINRRLNEGS